MEYYQGACMLTWIADIFRTSTLPVSHIEFTVHQIETRVIPIARALSRITDSMNLAYQRLCCTLLYLSCNISLLKTLTWTTIHLLLTKAYLNENT